MIVVLALRTWAVWTRDKRVGVGLALLLGLYQIPHVIIFYKFTQGFGCEYLNSASVLVLVTWFNPSLQSQRVHIQNS